jgi:hypothetical protein
MIAPATQGNDAEAQRLRIMARLRLGPATTIDLRRDQDILQPMARVMELREVGHRIDTVWTRQETDCGKLHRVGEYVLVSEAKGAEGAP